MHSGIMKIAAAAGVALCLGACQSPGDRAVGGGVIGGLAGAGIGGLAGGGRGALIGGLAGAGTGALVGAATAPVRPSYGPGPYYEERRVGYVSPPVRREWREQPAYADYGRPSGEYGYGRGYQSYGPAY